MLWARFYHSERRQKKLIDDLSDKKSLS
jgi:hypothetical protein